MAKKEKVTKKNRAHQIYKLSDGTRVAGVTTIVNLLNKPALVPWANKLGLQGIDVTKHVDNLAEIGTLAHTMVEDYLQGNTTDFSDYTANQKEQAENSVISFFEWLKNHKIELIFSEKQLVSELWRYGGTGDIYAKVDGVNELIEIKTGSGIWPEHFIQTSANMMLLRENDCPVERGRILNIPRGENEAFAEAIVPNVEKNFEIFKHLLRVYEIKKELKGD